MTETIYLDNAATSHPKPEEAYVAADSFARQGGSPGRSAHRLALLASGRVFEVRHSLARLLGVKQPERIVLTGGCTLSLNMVLGGLRWKPGDVVLVSALEHNAVMRCLRKLACSHGIKVVTVPYSPGTIISVADLESLCRQHKPELAVFTEASNVTGEKLDVASVAAVCKSNAVKLLVDAAQSAGAHHEEIACGVSFWCAGSHKGLLGVAGAGLLWVAEDQSLEPFVAGGTGSRSDSEEMPDALPDRLEPGTAPGPAISSMGAGADWLLGRGRQKVARAELNLADEFLFWAGSQPRLKVFGGGGPRRVPLVSFRVDGVDSSFLAGTLDREYGIATRSGLHCAVAAHKTLGTQEGGLVRVSFGPFNRESDVVALCKALESITAACRSR